MELSVDLGRSFSGVGDIQRMALGLVCIPIEENLRKFREVPLQSLLNFHDDRLNCRTGTGHSKTNGGLRGLQPIDGHEVEGTTGNP
mmetsp:Transcript_8869/g.17898  ORF Transcript_8869/g.17898 Transcript_8869/m.17898 type:complete len:86 (-) Transcript_8869:344-601(-)